MKNAKLLGLMGILTLALASCGGGSTPTPGGNAGGGTGTGSGPVATDPGTVAGGTITKPTDSTAAGEFVVTGERAQALAQSLGIQTQSLGAESLQAQAVTDELRILLAVTRATSGTNAGKKRAVATFVWGNGAEKITVAGDPKLNKAVTLDIYPQGSPNTVNTYTGSLDLMVQAPDFQDKTTRSGNYMADTGAACARLVFDLTSKSNAATAPAGYVPLLFNNAVAPLEVCEGTTEKNAEQVALTKYSDAVQYEYQSSASAPWLFQRFDTETVLPTSAHLLELEGLAAGLPVTTQTVAAFFAPLEVLPTGDPMTWTTMQKAAAATAKKYTSLRKQIGYYYPQATVYRVQISAEREGIYVMGKNGWGLGSIKTIRYLP